MDVIENKLRQNLGRYSDICGWYCICTLAFFFSVSVFWRRGSLWWVGTLHRNPYFLFFFCFIERLDLLLTMQHPSLHFQRVSKNNLSLKDEEEGEETIDVAE